MINIICIAVMAASALVFAVMHVQMRREYRRALARIGRPVDGQPLGYRNLRVLEAIVRDTEQHPVQEPAYRTGRPS